MKNTIIILLLMLVSFTGFSQYKGIVKNENNEEIPGVSVIVKETQKTVITNLNGKFSVKAKEGNTLIFKYIGCKTKEVTLTNNYNLNIVLIKEELDIDEIVVMGYSTKNLTEISSAVSVINEDELFDVTTNDVGSLLQGKVSGVQVINSSGEPGAGAQIRIRGISTIKPGNDEPLYVVDGIIGGSFDPNDIASITILKDAGATGMYGARANKGVIIITTKSAKSGKAKFNFKSSFGYKTPNHGNLKMMSGEEFYETSAEMFRDYETHQIDKIRFYQYYPQELKTKNFNWVNETFKPAFIQNYYVSASGGEAKNSYFMSASYFDEGGTFLNTNYKRLNFRINQKTEFSKRLSLTNNLNISGSKGSSYEYMDMYYSYLSIPWDNGYKDGKPFFVDGSSSDWWSRDKINPIHSADNSDYNSKDGDVNYDLSLKYKINDWISFNSNNRIGFNTSKSHSFVSPRASGTYFNKGFVSEIQTLWYGGISTNMLKIDKSFDKHNINGLIGFETEKGYYEDILVEGKGIPDGFDVPATASKEIKIGGANSVELIMSGISQVNYNFDKKYFLTASYRVDVSSNFPSGNRVAKFPAVSASWMLSKEDFLLGNNIIRKMKLRASWGITGDPDIGASRYMGLFDLSTQYNGNSAATPYQLQNYDLTWEKTNQNNIGLDISLLNMLDITIDAYKNITKDLIVLVAQPLSQGFEYRWENQGQVTNTGIEIAVNANIIKRKKIQWDINFSAAYNKSKLSGIEVPFYRSVSGISQIYKNGGDIYTFMLPKWLGVDEQTGAPLWEKIEKDENGNIIKREPTSNYAEADPQEVGKALPDLQGGFGSSLKYGRFHFNTTFAFQYGNDIYNFTRMFMDHDGHEPYYNYMQPKKDWKRWEKPGDIATHPSMQNNTLSNQISSRFLEDGSFIKLRNISLAYDVPFESFAKNKITAFTISISADNIRTFTNFWGQDPEVALSQGDWSMPGVSDFKYPNNTQYVLNIDIKF